MNVVFLDVDTQKDFMDPDGALSVPGAQGIRENIGRLIKHALDRKIPVVATADYHAPDDPEFAQFPPHCVINTRGADKIPETLPQGHPNFREPAVVGVNGPVPGTFPAPIPACGDFIPMLRDCPMVIMRKETFTVFQNPHFAPAMKELKPDLVVVFGVAAEYCVKAAVMGLLEHGYKVDVVSDAIKGITAEGERAASAEMKAGGAGFVTTGEVLIRI